MDPLGAVETSTKVGMISKGRTSFCKVPALYTHAHAFCRLQKDPLDAVDTGSKVGISSKGRNSFCKEPASHLACVCLLQVEEGPTRCN